jgi:hypothetical protein
MKIKLVLSLILLPSMVFACWRSDSIESVNDRQNRLNKFAHEKNLFPESFSCLELFENEKEWEDSLPFSNERNYKIHNQRMDNHGAVMHATSVRNIDSSHAENIVKHLKDFYQQNVISASLPPSVYFALLNRNNNKSAKMVLHNFNLDAYLLDNYGQIMQSIVKETTQNLQVKPDHTLCMKVMMVNYKKLL